MSKALEQRVEQLTDQVYALQQLLLAHVLAFDEVDRLATDATFTLAVDQLDSTLDRGRDGVAHRLAALMQSVQRCRN